MKIKIIAFFVTFVINFRTCQSKLYTNYSLYNLIPSTKEHLTFLRNLNSQKYIDVVFWNKPNRINDSVQVMVNMMEKELFFERAKHFDLSAKLLVPNVQMALDSQIVKRYARLRTETFSWDCYHDLEDIYQWLADLYHKNPSITELITYGKSAEGRELYAFKVNHGGNGPNVIVEGGIHSNEWLSVTFATYLLNKILYATNDYDKGLRYLAKKFTWYFLPVTNPDGYFYTHTQDRLWRKNRRNLPGFIGVDLNRNFNLTFGNNGSCFGPGDDYYCGTHALSEPETKALANFVKEKSKKLRYYFSLHAFGQKIIIPYADSVKHIDNYFETSNYAKQASTKMYKLYGKKYEIGTHYDLFGAKISGDSASWVKRNLKIPFVYTFLLRDDGSFGYALPNDQIEPACKEAMVGLKEIMTARPKRIIRTSDGVYSFPNAGFSLRIMRTFVASCLSFIFIC